MFASLQQNLKVAGARRHWVEEVRRIAMARRNKIKLRIFKELWRDVRSGVNGSKRSMKRIRKLFKESPISVATDNPSAILPNAARSWLERMPTPSKVSDTSVVMPEIKGLSFRDIARSAADRLKPSKRYGKTENIQLLMDRPTSVAKATLPDEADAWLGSMSTPSRTLDTAVILPEVNMDDALEHEGSLLHRQNDSWVVTLSTAVNTAPRQSPVLGCSIDVAVGAKVTDSGLGIL